MKSKDVTLELYPVLHANTYTVQYADRSDDDVVTGNVDASTQTYDKEFSLAENKFVRKGYTFEGWVKVDGTEETLYEEGQEVKNLAESGTVTLYAKWKKNEESEDVSEKAESKEDNAEQSTEEVEKSEKEVHATEKNTSEGKEQDTTANVENGADE